MTPSGLRSLCTVLTVTVIVGFAVSLVGCASAGHSPVAVSDMKSVAGTWKGIVYERSEVEPNYVVLTIREDGSYDVVSDPPVGAIGASRGKGKIVISEGRLLFEGERGRGVGTLLRSRGGDLIMNVDATLSDNSTLSAELSRSR
jgi:hypothetical protein